MRLHIKSLVSLLHLWFKIKINLFNIVAAVQLGKKKIRTSFDIWGEVGIETDLNISEKKWPNN